MPAANTPGMRDAECGAVLVLAMLFSLLLAIVATTVMRTAVMQWHMAGNNQFREEAFLHAQAIASELSLAPGNFPLAGEVGYTNCHVGATGPDCDLAALSSDAAARVHAGLESDYRIVRQDPLFSRGFPLRESQSRVSSSGSFDAAIYEIEVRIDGSQQRLGSAHLVQGIALRVGAQRQEGAL